MDNEVLIRRMELSELLDGALSLQRDRHFIVTGDWGSGKTALLQFAAKRFRDEGHLAAMVNVWVESGAQSIFTTIARACAAEVERLGEHQRSVAAAEFSRQLFGKRVAEEPTLERLLDLLEAMRGPDRLLFLLFDDLDRLLAPQDVLRVIGAISRARRPGIRIILAASSAIDLGRLGPGPPFWQINLEPLSNSEATSFLNALVEHRLAPELLNAMIEDAGGNPRLLQDAARGIRGGVPPKPAAADIKDPEEHRRLLLQLMAILGAEPLDGVVRLTDLPRGHILALAAGTGLGVNDLNILDFTLSKSRDSILRELLPATAVLAFGDEAAERDALLDSDGFIVRPDFDEILEGTKTIVLGDRGAGKSAIFRKMATLAAGRERDLLFASAADPATFLQIAMGGGEHATPERFKAIWLLYCAALAAKHIHPLLDPQVPLHAKYIRDCHTILRNVGWDSAVKNEPWWRSPWRALKTLFPSSIEFTFGPVQIKPAWSLKPSSQKFPLADFLAATDRVLVEIHKTLLIVFDQVDEAWKYERNVQELLIQGYFSSEAYLSQTRFLRMVVLLRTDLFEIYDIQEKNKMVTRTIRLGWTERELLAMMRARLFANDALTSLRELAEAIDARTGLGTEVMLRAVFPAEVEGERFVDWLLEGLRSGRGRVSPRQIVLFLKLAQESLKRDARRGERYQRAPIFSHENVTDAMTQISSLSYEEVINDYRVAPGFVRSCRAGNLTEFSDDQVKGLFDASDGNVLHQIERLERLGFMERLAGFEGERAVSRFRVPRLYSRCWQAAPVP